MLACLGPVIFDIRNDLQTIDQEVKSSFAKHDVMGAAPVYEDTGDSERPQSQFSGFRRAALMLPVPSSCRINA